MKPGSLAAASLAIAATLPLFAQQPTPAPAPAYSSYDSSMNQPPPKPARPHETVLKLWKSGKFSEDFIRQQIDQSPSPFDLTPDEMIYLRDQGMPESIVSAMLARRGMPTPPPPLATPAPATPPRTGAPATAMTAPTTPPAVIPPPEGGEPRKWEGLVRRNGGVVIFKSRWDAGSLEFKEGTVYWRDADEEQKNLLIPARAIEEQSLTCLKKAGGNECFEWVIKTANDEYRFRDIAWERDMDGRKVMELYDFFKASFPSLISSPQVPVDKK